MLTTLLILVGIVAAVALVKLRAHHRAATHLLQAIEARQPFLHDEIPGAHDATWKALCDAANHLITTSKDIEQQRTTQLTQLETTLGSLQEAVLIVDEANRVRLANQALQAIFPRARAILGQRLELVLQSDIFITYVEAVRAGRAQPRREVEFVDGARSVWAEVTGSTISALDGTPAHWLLFVVHDITRQRQLERVRKDFVANVSHELRTPLSVIKGYVETLVDGHDDLPANDRARFLRTIQRHTERLNSLLEDLLTLSRLESVDPGLRSETTDLSLVLREVFDDYRSRPAATDHSLLLTLAPDTGIATIDPLKITQVLENLLDNAFKYTPKGSRVEIATDARETEIVIRVSDNGPGIPAPDLPHIFERFYRVDKGRSREKGGTGLGLSIVKHIVQLHGGRVWAESRLGEGTSFLFSLPRRREA